MRILHVHLPLESDNNFDPGIRTLRVAQAMDRVHISTAILTTQKCLPGYAGRLSGTDIEILICSSTDHYFSRARRQQLTRLLKPFDLVHITNYWTYLNALVYHACKEFKKPYVICPAGDQARTGKSGRLHSFFNALVGRNQIRRAAAHVAINNGEIENFKEYKIPPEKVLLIPNGITPQDFTLEPRPGFFKRHGLLEAPYILSVGRLQKGKGQDLLLEAFLAEAQQGLADFHLVFVGSDSGLEKTLKARTATSTAKDRIHFTGYLDHQALVQAYHGATLLAVTERQAAHNKPTVVLEAGACGTPVLLTETCDFADLQEAGGCLIAPTSEAGLQEALKTMATDQKLLKKMGERLKVYVEAHYTWETVAHRYITLYREILEEPQP